MAPLTHWFCDKCGQTTDVGKGWLEWLDPGSKPSAFRIVHNQAACFHYSNHPNRSDNHLRVFIGPDGLQYFLSMLDVGPVLDPTGGRRSKIGDMANFVDTVRRIHIPYYEEARQYFDEARSEGWFNDMNEYSIFIPDTCRRIIEHYKR